MGLRMSTAPMIESRSSTYVGGPAMTFAGASEETDRSGQALVERAISAGHHVAEKRIVPDDVYRIRAVVAAWIADPEVQVIMTTGGTGFTGRDSTPEAVSVLLDKRIEGFGERFRLLSGEEIGSSTIQSRCLGGLANATVIFCLPGSTGACRTAWDGIPPARRRCSSRSRKSGSSPAYPAIRTSGVSPGWRMKSSASSSRGAATGTRNPQRSAQRRRPSRTLGSCSTIATRPTTGARRSRRAVSTAEPITLQGLPLA